MGLWQRVFGGKAKRGHETLNLQTPSGSASSDKPTNRDEPAKPQTQTPQAHVTSTKFPIPSAHNPKTLNPDLNPRLIDAAERGDAEMVCSLLAEGADPNATGENQSHVVMYASLKGNKELLEALLKNGAAPDAPNFFGCRPLFIAALEGHLEAVKLLVEHGANVNAASDDGNSPLIGASQNGHIGVVRYLLEKGAHSWAATKLGTTALMRAVQNGHSSVALQLLASGAEVNAKDSHGFTAWDFIVEGNVTDQLVRGRLRGILGQFGAIRS